MKTRLHVRQAKTGYRVSVVGHIERESLTRRISRLHAEAVLQARARVAGHDIGAGYDQSTELEEVVQ